MDNYLNNNPSILNQAIAARMRNANQAAPAKEEQAEAVSQQGPALNPKSGEEVLNSLANAGNLNFIVSQIQTKPDFSAGLEERIAGFMSTFEESITTFLQEADNEFADVPEYQNLSDEDKMALAAEMFNQTFMPDAAGDN